MISALFYLQSRSFWNGLVMRFKRLKKPKYLIGLIVGGLYFYLFFFRWVGRGGGARVPADSSLASVDWSNYAVGIELVAALILFVVVAVGWIVPRDRAALAFSEAELVFLFSAPIHRSTLLHYKLLKSQIGILITTLFMALISTGFGRRGSPWINLGGWWVILSLLNLHLLGASFARTRWLEKGFTNWQRQLGLLAVLAVGMAAVFWWARDTMRAPTEAEFARFDWKTIANYVQEVLQTGPAPWLLYPFRLVVRPYLAKDAMSFLAALWPCLLLFGLHYVWVMRSKVSFEEASLALAQKRAQLLSAAKQGHLAPVKHKARRGPFALAAAGPPAVAFLWKNLIAAGSLFRARSVVFILIMLLIVGLSVSLGSRRSGAGAVIGMLVLMALMWSVMLGPMLLRHDFRSDLKAMDTLKVYPLAGWRIVLGELLAPALVLTVVQWLLLLLGVMAAGLSGDAAQFGFAQRLSVGAGVALVLPMLNVISFIIPNAAVLLFPAWFQTGQDATQGIEATGQRLVFGLGQFFVFLIALAPAGGAGLLAFLLAKLALPWTLALPLAAVPAALVLAAEAAVGIGLLGKVFEKFDLSAEPQT